uniref:Uncharacterized protein n=1 Tax=viral metagenome TaxID=1070528 RepID=A0A6H1Z7B5_9ZZZZ
MQQKSDLNELIEALLTLARNPIVLELAELKKLRDGRPIVEFMSRYDGFKDGEFLAFLSSLFGLSFSSGMVTCYSGAGSNLADLLSSLYTAFADPGARLTLATYLGVERVSSPELFRWKRKLSSLTDTEKVITKALVNLGASEFVDAKSIDEIAAEAQKVEPGAEVTKNNLALMVRKMPIEETKQDNYFIRAEHWDILKEALVTLEV